MIKPVLEEEQALENLRPRFDKLIQLLFQNLSVSIVKVTDI